MTHEPLIQLTGISAAYDRKQVLTDVNLTVYEKDFLGVIGPNGGGKTTLMKVILGLLKPVHGTIRFFRHGKEVPEVSIGYLPQYNHIDKKFPISVYEVVLSGLNKQKSLFSRFTAEQHRQVERTIARMGLEGLEQRAIGQLSGGQLQRALLGRAIVSCPQLIILDEPNTYIDKRFEAKLYSVNGTLDYHPDTEIPAEWLEEHFGCPIELLGHGNLPHRVLKCHNHSGEH